ncbi:hypothetical protein [Mucilaginibacter robiniae]|uniref:hypothetical protein n=1 Tax=Mucilaginibacter robiniae TaxID=2728022 RepID=UPI002006DFFA|nr:hypothetical protein [Mucilaginibacter robiniae]
MNKHHGQIVEYTVRKGGYSISELSNELGVNRRSLYNWFKQAHLKSSIIYRIGNIIHHDFSTEFPELFSSTEFKKVRSTASDMAPVPDRSSFEEKEVWKNKYLVLLEQYNQLLNKQIKITTNKYLASLVVGASLLPLLMF